MKRRVRKPIGEWFGEQIAPGETRDVALVVSESYSSADVRIPIRIARAEQDGPVVFVTAALHGDELNGTGAIRQLIQDPEFRLLRGAVIMIPVLNILAFERNDRYLPDRRDLNRSFPGMATGSLASRMARILFQQIVHRSDYGIDLHTAAVRRTNYPNVRADLANARIRRLAESFGTEVIMNGVGPKGALRREASKAGCPTIVMEGGEVWKVEPEIVGWGARGVRNVLRGLEMLGGEPERPAYQIVIEKSKWVRAERGGFLQFRVRPGEVVAKDQLLAINTTLLGDVQNELRAPFDAVVVGMASLPAVGPGEAVCNLGKLPEGVDPAQLREWRKAGGSGG